MVLTNKLFLQIMRFVIVGGTAALVNFLVVVYFVEIQSLRPLTANIIAFMLAFQVSYFGHRLWTFNESSVEHRTAIPRLLLIAISNFFANEGLFYVFLNIFHLQYMLALFCTLAILPAYTFTVSKLWVFR